MNSRTRTPSAAPRGFCSALALSFTVLIAVASPARAAVSVYTDLISFNSALTGAGLSGTTYGFTTGPGGVGDPDSLTTGPASFAGLNSGAAAGFFLSDDYGITGTFYSHQLFNQDGDNAGGNRLLITFAAPVLGFAFDSNAYTWPDVDLNPNSWPTSGDTAMTLTTGNGDALDLSTAAYDGSGPAPSRFNGILSTTEFSSVTLSLKGMNFQTTGFTVAAIPEPSTYALVLSGLSLAVVAGRRMRRRGLT